MCGRGDGCRPGLNKPPATAVTAKIATTAAVPMAAKTGQRLRRLAGGAGGIGGAGQPPAAPLPGARWVDPYGP